MCQEDVNVNKPIASLVSQKDQLMNDEETVKTFHLPYGAVVRNESRLSKLFQQPSSKQDKILLEKAKSGQLRPCNDPQLSEIVNEMVINLYQIKRDEAAAHYGESWPDKMTDYWTTDIIELHRRNAYDYASLGKKEMYFTEAE